MQKQILLGILLLVVLSVNTFVAPSLAVDTLTPNDFKLESFSKTIDFFDFARENAANADKPVPPEDWHAYLYQVYINVSGFQLYYSGLINITKGEGTLTVPVQSFLEHYKTPGSKDVLTSSSFIMLLAFNDTASSLYKDSPDKNDDLYASFSLGLDLTNIYGDSRKPALCSETSIIPLTSSADKLIWDWGMRYTNLTAVWWRMFIDPQNPRYEPLPIAIATYEELAFMYKLTLNPTNNTATLSASYVIGRMTNLWLIYWLGFIPIVAHYNSTGTYRLNGAKISDENIYQFLENQHIKMSMVLFQNSLVLNYATASTFNSQNVTDAEVDVSKGVISTGAGNEKIFEANFGTKSKYQLYNYSADNAEMGPYDAVTRTAPRYGFARNPLFALHVALLKYVPLIVAHMDPQLYQRAKDYMLNMTYADYFYLISYPEYGGFKIVHDPTYTAYIASTTLAPEPTNLFTQILIGGTIAAAVLGVIYVLKRRVPAVTA